MTINRFFRQRAKGGSNQLGSYPLQLKGGVVNSEVILHY